MPFLLKNKKTFSFIQSRTYLTNRFVKYLVDLTTDNPLLYTKTLSLSKRIHLLYPEKRGNVSDFIKKGSFLFQTRFGQSLSKTFGFINFFFEENTDVWRYGGVCLTKKEIETTYHNKTKRKELVAVFKDYSFWSLIKEYSFFNTIKKMFNFLFFNEECSAYNQIEEIDETFTQEVFIERLHRRIIPDILDALYQGKNKVLTEWCNEKVISALITEKERSFLKTKKDQTPFCIELKDVEIERACFSFNVPIIIASFEATIILPETVEFFNSVWSFKKNKNKNEWKIVDVCFSK